MYTYKWLESKAGSALGLIRDPKEHLQSFWAKGQFYEQDMLEHIWVKAGYGGTFIDVGSCIGNHTLFFARFCADEVISIEPMQDLILRQAELLIVNLVANKVSLIQTAAGEITGLSCKVVNEEAPKNLGMGKVLPMTGSIKQITIDELDVEPVVIKIDVEGYELEVLKGAQETISQYKPYLYVEILEDEKEVRQLLDDLGYVCVQEFEPFKTWEFVPR